MQGLWGRSWYQQVCGRPVASGSLCGMSKPTRTSSGPTAPSSPKPVPAAAQRGAGQVRIIGGRLRGSRLPVPPLSGLRPSSDRMRETLFNWLMHETAGARCLDLFAGSGALGFEAASRGAARVVMVERDIGAAAGLRASALRLKLDVDVHCGEALAWLQQAPPASFDIAFVDPPFAAGLLAEVLQRLPRLLSPRAWLYVESAPGPSIAPAAGWQLHRELATRQAHGRLYRRLSPASA